MMNAAIPDYIGNNFSDAPPGHKFGLYFPVWNNQTWTMEDRSKTEALKKTLSIPTESRHQIEAIRSRQFALVNSVPESTRLTLEALSTSPMVTGMGMEHPLENGFAFLNPYGLPYLPGSSIKGVLRQAARELDWDEEVVSMLFGRDVESGDTTTQRTRGALTFWDAIPELAGHTLGMDVMTPHYKNYYQGTRTPHDADSPTPIVFMVVPAGAQFSFHMTADPIRLKEVDDWQALMQGAFEHAFKWLGFGAKTSVGYGAMLRDKTKENANKAEMESRRKEAEEEALSKKEAEAHEAVLAQLNPIEREITEFASVVEAIKALEGGQWSGEEQKQAAHYLKQRMQTETSKNDQWKEETTARRPGRDKAYQRTLQVMRYL